MPERRGEVRIGDRVVFSGAEYSVVALSGSLVRLLADSGDAVVVAMAYLAGAPDFAVVGAGPRTRLVPSGLPKDAETGTAPRPEYDPAARTLTERQQAKADELGVTLRTVERMRRRYLRQGLWGLVDASARQPAASASRSRSTCPPTTRSAPGTAPGCPDREHRSSASQAAPTSWPPSARHAVSSAAAPSSSSSTPGSRPQHTPAAPPRSHGNSGCMHSSRQTREPSSSPARRNCSPQPATPKPSPRRPR